MSLHQNKLFFFGKVILLSTSVLLFAAALLAFPKEAAAGVSNGISYCLNLLVPSLFPFMALSTFVASSGLAEFLGRPFAPLMRFLFRLPPCAAPVLFMGMAGGYPVGARGIASLRKEGKLTDDQAVRMLYFCVNAGPAFTISTVGAALFGDLSYGLLLFLSQAPASLLIGIALRFSSHSSFSEPSRSASSLHPQALTSAVSSASKGMFQMCAFVVLFSVLTELLRSSGILAFLCRSLLFLGVPHPSAAVLPSMILEITGGCRDAALLGSSIPAVAFGLGWGGLCVHFQVLAAAGDIPIRRTLFFLFRLVHGLLSAAIVSTLLPWFPKSEQVFFGSSVPVAAQPSGSAAAAAALVMLCGAFLLVVGKDTGKLRKNMLQ